MKKSLFLLLAVAGVFWSCQRNTMADVEQDNVWEAYRSPAFKHISLYDTLPKRAVDYLSAVEINGVRATYPSGKHTSYHEYVADPIRVLFAVQSIPFAMNEGGDTLCREMNRPFTLSGQRVLSREEKLRASFFWEVNPDEFLYYECVKGVQRHTILISKNSKRILHRIEMLA
jgi:hypothetical protein